jgi:hypothetical protein
MRGMCENLPSESFEIQKSFPAFTEKRLHPLLVLR